MVPKQRLWNDEAKTMTAVSILETTKNGTIHREDWTFFPLCLEQERKSLVLDGNGQWEQLPRSPKVSKCKCRDFRNMHNWDENILTATQVLDLWPNYPLSWVFSPSFPTITIISSSTSKRLKPWEYTRSGVSKLFFCLSFIRPWLLPPPPLSPVSFLPQVEK